jgi:serine/threonine-protein kinase
MQGSIDRRSDVFSLGIVLYEMTTLRTPFGDTLGDDAAIMQRIVDGAYPPPAQIVADFPPELAAIIARCLAPVRELRYPDAEELRAELVGLIGRQRWATGPPDLARHLRALFGDRTPPWLDDPPTRIVARGAATAEPDDEPTVIAPPPPRLLALAGGEAPPPGLYAVGDAIRVDAPAAPPGDDTTTLTERRPAPRVAPRARRGPPLPVAIALALTTLIALGLAARWFG